MGQAQTAKSGSQLLPVSPKALSWDTFSEPFTSTTSTLVLIISNKFADNKIGNGVLSEAARRMLQDLRKITHWSVKWKIPVNINKCRTLEVGSRNTKKD